MRCTASSIPAQQPHDPAYADDPYAYQDGYGDEPEEPVKKRSGGMITVVAVLALAVVGTGAAFAYRTYVGSPRSGEPPIIRADTGPTKIVPAPADGSAKVPDRMASGDGAEKIVPREEAPVDVNAQVRPARGVSAAEPECQSAARGERGDGRAGAGQRRQRHAAEQRAAQDQDPGGPGRSDRCRAGRRAAAGETSSRGRRGTGAGAASGLGCRNADAVFGGRQRQRSTANAPMSLTPQGGQPAPAAEPRPGSQPTIRRRPLPARRRIPGSGLLAEERGRRAGLLPGPAGQVPGRAGIALAVDQARRSRRKGRLLPRHGRPVRIPG